MARNQRTYQSPTIDTGGQWMPGSGTPQPPQPPQSYGDDGIMMPGGGVQPPVASPSNGRSTFAASQATTNPALSALRSVVQPSSGASSAPMSSEALMDPNRPIPPVTQNPSPSYTPTGTTHYAGGSGGNDSSGNAGGRVGAPRPVRGTAANPVGGTAAATQQQGAAAIRDRQQAMATQATERQENLDPNADWRRQQEARDNEARRRQQELEDRERERSYETDDRSEGRDWGLDDRDAGWDREDDVSNRDRGWVLEDEKRRRGYVDSDIDRITGLSKSGTPGTIPPPGGGVGGPGGSSSTNANLLRAKEQQGQIARSSLTGLRSALGATGMLGSGAEAEATAGLAGDAMSGISNINRQGYIEDEETARQNTAMGYQGAITQRGQDITSRGQTMNAILQALRSQAY